MDQVAARRDACTLGPPTTPSAGRWICATGLVRASRRQRGWARVYLAVDVDISARPGVTAAIYPALAGTIAVLPTGQRGAEGSPTATIVLGVEDAQRASAAAGV